MPTLEKALATYLKVDRSEYTNRNYHQCLSKMVEALGPQRRISFVTYEELLDYTAQYRQQYNPATCRQYVIVIKAFFNWAVKLRYIEWSPATMLSARKPSIEQINEIAVPADVLDAAMTLAYNDFRDYAVIAFIKGTAARVGGIASLRLPNLDLHNGQAWIRNKGGAYFWAYFGPNTSEALRRYLTVRPQVKHDYVFVSKTTPDKPLEPSSYSYIVATWTRRASGKKYYGHSVRHRTTHDWNTQHPVDVLRDKLHHSSVTITNAYLHRQNPQLSRISQQMDPIRQDAPESPQKRSKIIYLDDAG